VFVLGGTCVCFGWDLCLFWVRLVFVLGGTCVCFFSVGLVFVFEWDLCLTWVGLVFVFWVGLVFFDNNVKKLFLVRLVFLGVGLRWIDT